MKLQRQVTAINRFLVAHNHHPKPFTWTADPDKIIAAVKRGHQVLARPIREIAVFWSD